MFIKVVTRQYQQITAPACEQRGKGGENSLIL